MTAPQLPALEDAYELGAELGRGGLGRVLAGRQRSTGRAVAIKLPLEGAPLGDDARVLREAALLGDLTHPRLVQLVEAARTARGALALVYQRLEGRPLAAVLAEGPPDRAAVAGWIRDACAGVAALHRVGLVHRDLKPGNLMLEPDGRVRVFDFGLLRSTLAGTTLTRDGVVVGTVAYMAPEQLLGERVGPAADLFALGCVAFHCLAGRAPFSGDPAEVARAHLQGPPRLEDPAEAVVLRALARDPGARPADLEQWAGELGAVLAAAPRARPPRPTALVAAPREAAPLGATSTGARTLQASPLAAPARPPGRRRPLTALLAVATLGLAVAWWSRPAPAAAPAATPPPPAGPGAAACLREALRELDTDSRVQAALDLVEGDDPTRVREVWTRARRAYLQRTEAVEPCLREAARAAWDPELYRLLGRLAQAEHHLREHRLSHVSPLFTLTPSRAGLLEAALDRHVEARRAETMSRRWPEDGRPRLRQARVALRRSGTDWQEVWGPKDYREVRGVAGDRVRAARITILDPRGRRAVPVGTLTNFIGFQGDELSTSDQRDRLDEDEGPPQLRVDLPPPPPGEGVTVLVLYRDWDVTVRMDLTLIGADRSVLRPVRVPNLAGEDTSEKGRTFGLYAHFLPHVLPRPPLRLRLEARSIQVTGDPSSTVHPLALFARTGGELPLELGH